MRNLAFSSCASVFFGFLLLLDKNRELIFRKTYIKIKAKDVESSLIDELLSLLSSYHHSVNKRIEVAAYQWVIFIEIQEIFSF